MFAVASALVLGQQPARPNVLLITLDTLRADRVGAYGYAKGATPTLDRLAREGVRFTDATTQAPLTAPAHAAILSGQYPARFGVRDNATTPVPADALMLAELFKREGYRTGGFVGAFILSAPYGFAQGFDTFDAEFSGYRDGMKLQVQRRCDAVVDAALPWLNAAAAQPFFAWVHLYDAHAPYTPPAPYSVRFRTAPYDGEVAYVDSCVGRLVQALEQSGRLDRTVVSLIADHGESLGEHGEQEHGFFLYEPVLRVPWILRLPARRHAGLVISDQARTIDVLPTLAALADVAVRGTIDGESLVPLLEGNKRPDPPPSYAETYYPKWHYGWSELKSVRIGTWKFIDAPRPELYDMRSDAAEQNNVTDARGALANGLSNEIGRIAATFGAAASTDAPQPDPETLARLRSLGYVGIATPSGGRGADPKDMIARAETFRTQLSRAMDALNANQPATAIAALKRLIAINDRSYELHLFLGDAYAATRQYELALGEYAAARTLNPNSASALLSSARVYLEQGDSRRARQSTDEAAAIEPGNGEVAMVRGMILEQQGQPRPALDQYAVAARANPSDSQARVRLASLAMRLKEYDLAEPQFQTLMRLGYRPSRMHFGLGQIAEARGDKARAAVEYRETLRLEPAFAEARNALARVTK